MSYYRYSYSVILLLLGILFCPSATVFAQQKHSKLRKVSKDGKQVVFTGTVVDAESGEAISWATIELVRLGSVAYSSDKGEFSFSSVPYGEDDIRIIALGYKPFSEKISITTDKKITFRLTPSLISLGSVEVLGTYRKGSDKVTINEEALKQIQPTNLGDVLLLLPGSIMKETQSIQNFSGVSSRQVMSEDNTSLGTAIIMNNTPISNDAMRTQLEGVTGESRFDSYTPDRLVTRRSSQNAGIDLRTLSTDHVERVEVERGISSASEGNLSYGSIRMYAKKGKAPFTVRAKSDPFNKLVYMGKGVVLPHNSGELHFGADYFDYTTDVREKLNRYNRISAQATYSMQQRFSNNDIVDWVATLHHSANLQRTRTDELVEEYDERYSSNYQRSTLSLQTEYTPHSIPLIDKITLTTSADVTYDLLDRKLYYNSPNGPRAMPLSREFGMHEGQYLPVAYHTNYQVENIPLYLWGHLAGESRFALFQNKFRHRILWGTEGRWAKNWGRGAIVDYKRPPFPGNNSFIWPRPNYAVPALSHVAAYLEDRFNLQFGTHNVAANIGIRATHMLNLPKNFLLAHNVLVEPRIKASWMWNATHQLQFTLRGGYGHEQKLPTLDYLYPDNYYRYFFVLNAYRGKDELNRLITYTLQHNPQNPQLRAALNRKMELGVDVRYSEWTFSATLFNELNQDGFSYFSQFHAVQYPYYNKLLAPIPANRPAEVTDYLPEIKKDFAILRTVNNAIYINKRGIEYRIRTPHIPVLLTQFELNGAYYHTVYASSVPIMYRPDVTLNGIAYPYVGFYGKGAYRHYKRFNTNLWSKTHVPQWGLVVTNLLQVIWFSDQFRGHEEQAYPYAYMNTDGIITPITPAEIDKAYNDGNPLLFLRQQREEIYYRNTRKPIAIRMNMKLTKEVGKHVRIAFFVDNVFDFTPKYKVANLVTDRQWYIPYFGVETQLQF